MKKTNRIILHIGPTKTGTSAIQFFLKRNIKVLERNGIGYFTPKYLYNPYRNTSNAAFLMRAALERSGIHDGEGEYWTNNNLKEDVAAFIDYLTRFETQILSEEVLWYQTVRNPDFWMNLKDVIREYCGPEATIDIITYLRRQDEWLLSEWKENIRGVTDVAEDFRTAIKKTLDSGVVDYEKNLQILSACFGKRHIIARSYNEAVMNNGIIDDFLNCTGIAGIDGLDCKNHRIHPSFSLTMTEAYRLIKAGEVECNASRYTLNYVFHRMFLKEKKKIIEYPLTLKERRELLQYFRAGNCRVAEELLGRKELFSDEIEEYKLWEPNRERDIKNARALAALAERMEKSRNGDVEIPSRNAEGSR